MKIIWKKKCYEGNPEYVEIIILFIERYHFN